MLLGGLLLFLVEMIFSAELRADQKNSWSLASPDGQCVISVSLGDGGKMAYEVRHKGKLVIRKSPLGLLRDDEDFERALVLADAGQIESRSENYDLFAGIAPRVDHSLNHRTLVFRNANRVPIELELAAGNEGVAFRYHFPENSGKVRVVQSELTGFKLPSESKGWLQPYHAASDYTPAYEDFYFDVAPGDPPPRSRAKPMGWAFPALFHVPNAETWVLLTESGTDESYCACHLGPDSSGGLYRIAFPLANEATKGQTFSVGPEPRYALPWTMPWRVLVLGKSARDIATATLVTDLAPPSRITGTSWIKPGRASWAWWSYPEGPATKEMFDHFTDFAAKMGWEYTLFDAGWWKPGLSNISAHAISLNVAPWAWLHARDFYDPRQRTAKLDQMAAAGIRGVKVDFWCSDRQETIAAMQSLFQEAALRRMLVNLHGCTIPRGWQRTWPNFLTAEAVLGCESYFYEPHYTEKAAELNTVLPFTRNAVGPMDSTPVACSPKKYPRTTTAAHELATGLVITSGLVHYADKPEFFESLPAEALQVFRDAPARWDETICLVGEPGRVVVFARRSGATWFIAGLNGTSDLMPVDLDLSPYAAFLHRLAITEAKDAAMQVAVTTLRKTNHWQHKIPPRGGFILRLDR
ncbi:MAG: putative alpha-glucosidase [Pedosphaera sp.]|nr:putative alpha-glucosidase [Pedosphaera sp.]